MSDQPKSEQWQMAYDHSIRVLPSSTLKIPMPQVVPPKPAMGPESPKVSATPTTPKG